MYYPLGNDEQGAPLDVPPQASGWLVRRHAGGRGRPGSIYDGDGRPLVLPLTATAADLRAAAVGPGMYRLDAVNDQRQVVGAVGAYTELTADGTDAFAVDGKPGSSVDAVLVLLARMVEKEHQARAEERRQDRELLRQALVQNHETLRAVVGRNVELTAPRLGEPTLKTVDQLSERVRQEAAATEARRNAAPEKPDLSALGPWEALLVPTLQPLLMPLVGVVAQEARLWQERRRQAHDARLAGVAETVPAPRNAAAPAEAAAPHAAPVPPSAGAGFGDGSYAFDLEPDGEDEDEDEDGEDENESENENGDDHRDAPTACTPVARAADAPAAPPAPAGAPGVVQAATGAGRDEDGREALKPLLAMLGVPAGEVEAIADRLDAVLDQLPADDVAQIGLIVERASPSEWALMRELIAPLARMSREEAVAYAVTTLVPAISQRIGGNPPNRKVNS